MFSKVTYIEEKNVPTPVKKVTEGVHPVPHLLNCLPVNFREVTEKDIVQKSLFLTYGAEYTYFTQAHVDGPDKAMVSLSCFIFHDATGIALSKDYWAGKLRYFMFGCEHSFIEFGSAEALAKAYPEHAGKYQRGMHMHNSVCEKCHYLRIVDSSG